jgi:hypothetical protein
MTRLLLSLLLATSSAAAAAQPAENPLVGAWTLEKYVDTPEGGEPVFVFGEQPSGLFVFTADGHVSISLMRNPPEAAPGLDPDPDGCVPDWFCAYYGTYDYDPAESAWTTHVAGANIPNYIGTDQRRRFRIEGDRLIISETFQLQGRTVQAERVLRRLGVP